MTKARDLANASTALSAVSATELAFVDGVTSAIQTQMDAKASLTGTETLTNKTLTNPVIASVINNTLTSTTGYLKVLPQYKFLPKQFIILLTML